jgi:hypothetical protein
MAANTVKVRDANSSGDPSDLAVATTQLIIGDGTGFTAAALSGEATMTNAGVVSISDNIIDEANLKISNGPTNGQFLSAQSGNTGGLTWAVAGGAVAREGGNTTDATTTSTSQGDLLSVSSLSIAAAVPVLFSAETRKTTGAASYADIGLKLNAVSIHAATGGGGFWTTDGLNELQHGGVSMFILPRVTSYQHGLMGSYTVYDAVGLSRSGHGAKITNALPIATITDLIITGSTNSASNTLGADELHVYSMAVS